MKAAVDRLRANSGSAIDVLTRDVNAFVVEAKATYRLDCDSMTAMWEAYCELDWEPTEDTDKSKAESVASSRQSTMKAEMGELRLLMKGLRDRATALNRRGETKRQAQSLIADLDKEQERLDRMFKNDVWHGVNDPLKFYAAE